MNKENTFQVQQTFGCAPDEMLFGFGQHQDGIWNWRGMPIELQQQNTSIAIPFFVSTKGYGVLWDNAFRTTVNPVDQKIDLTLENTSVTTDATGQPKATEDLTAKPAKNPPPPLPVRHGNFTTTEAGEHVFFAQDGDRTKEFSLLVDDKPVAGVVNLWTPYTVAGSIELPANTTVRVTLRGGGKSPIVGARLRETGQTIFRSHVGDAASYTFFYGSSFDQVIDAYRQATGPAPLLPRWAFGFWQCRERHSNATFMRPLAMDFADDPRAVATSDEYMWGSAFLVAPVTAPKAETRRVHLPQGARWINFWTGEAMSGGQGAEVSSPLGQIPLFLRAGSIVPFGPELQYASEKPADPIELRIYPGADGAFTLYEDEGDSYRYEQGAYETIPMQWNDATHTLSFGVRTGDFPGELKQRTFKVILVDSRRGCGTTFDGTTNATVTCDGTAKMISLEP